MPVWRLIPIDLDDPNWEASSHRGLAVVRAPSEAAARETAKAAFGVRTRFSPGKGMKQPPWIDSPLYYAAEGPIEVLEPFE